MPIFPVGNLTPKRKVTQFVAVKLIHCRRVHRRNRSANGCPPYKRLSTLSLSTFNEYY
ncbi:MAG: hypothetical protein LBK82_03410 [Planctomycetaceae bacterium]|nr:hypothetical protein [Planctomycetaceae bacterium]